MNKVVVVSTAWCASCAVLKDLLTRNGIVYHTIDGDSEEGMVFCRENNVRSLPTSFIYDSEGNLIKSVVGVKKLEEYI